MTIRIATIDDVRKAEEVVRRHISASPLIRSWPLEKELGLPPGRRVWLKDYGWTPVGSFKLMGALNWVANHESEIGSRRIVAHSSGNFASGISFAGMRYDKSVVVVMPDTAPQVKCDRTRSFGAEIRTYDSARDHLTGDRIRMADEIEQAEKAVLAQPYDDPDVIAGNGVGGLEIVEELTRQDRELSHFVCAVSGGGLMAGHALAIADGFPESEIVGVEPQGASDFHQSLREDRRVRIDHPESICDGLLSYDVGEHNWPILRQHVGAAVTASDLDTQHAMKWLYHHHGLRVEPSGAITTAALLTGRVNVDGDGDIVAVVSGRNVDDDRFREWIAV